MYTIQIEVDSPDALALQIMLAKQLMPDARVKSIRFVGNRPPETYFSTPESAEDAWRGGAKAKVAREWDRRAREYGPLMKKVTELEDRLAAADDYAVRLECPYERG